MTSHLNPTPDETGHQAGQRQTIVEFIDQYLEDGMPVFDENGKKVGHVRMYSSAAGYLMVNTDALRNQYVYIPFRLIRTIDPREITLSAPKETLDQQYTQPPKLQTVVETRLATGPGGGMIPQTRQVQTLESGYDAMPATLNSASVDTIASRLAVGMVVYDVDGARLGNITHYDADRGLLTVEKGVLQPTSILIPFSDIASFSQDNLSVYLSLAKDTIVKEHGMLQ